MKNVLLSSLAAIAMMGCSFKAAQIQGPMIPFAEANYKVLGNTTSEVCGTHLLMIDWSQILSNDTAGIAVESALPIPIPSGGNLEQRRAMFDALEKIPEATHLLQPRWEQSFDGVGNIAMPFLGKRCATVHARGVKIGSGPLPN